MNKEDDPALYEAAKAELSLLKKELRNLISGQTQRLELILSSGRLWTKAAFEDLFIKNPIMAIFAQTLIFGTYEKDKLISTFRYNGDGSFSGPGDDPYEIPEEGEIRLVHPLHLSEDLKAQWKQQLADYEILQPFPQLDRKIYIPGQTREALTEYDLQGTSVNGGAFVRRLFKAGWKRGDIGDGGSYYNVEKTQGDYLLEVHFGEIDDFSVGNEFDTAIELESLTFTRLADRKGLSLKEVPPELYSETVYILEGAAAAARTNDPDQP
jgi:hypothetical protein